MTYLRNLWLALCGMPGHCVVSHDFIDEHTERQARVNDLESLTATQAVRIAKYERRAQSQRISRANRAIDNAANESTQ